MYKSKIYPIEEVNRAFRTPAREDFDLKTLEIAFDRTCQFACSYCNPAFSSTWVHDIKKHGAYANLVSDGRNHFTHTHDRSQLYKFGEINPYVEAFFKWWETDLHKTLQELRITGGEPLMSAETWKLIEWFKTNKGRSKTRLAINSNLGTDVDIDRLLEAIDGVEVDLYTSNESINLQAEYIRDGLDYKLWKSNLIRVATEGNLKGLHVMMTINSLCLFSITDFLTEIYDLKEHFGTRHLTVSVNLLRFPSFQSPLALPDHIKNHCRENLEMWYNSVKDKPLWHEFEKASIERLIDYLVTVDAPHRRTSNRITLWRDFKTFYSQYDIRRGKSISVFPKILTDWVDQLPDTVVETQTNLINGDSTQQYINDEQLNEIAKREGWILNPSNTNIERPLDKYE